MHPKKSLGQHFLTSQGALTKIIEVSDLKNTDTVLEIGPGRGILTTELLKHVKQVIAVEKDHELVLWLQIQFAEEIRTKKLVLINADILDFEFSNHNLKPKNPARLASESVAGRYKLVANIPYNITGSIIEKFLTTSQQPSLMTLLVQKEVAERVVAKDGKESILSLSVKAYGTPTYVQTVKAGSFNPPPKVDSAILSITDISRNQFHGAKVSEEQFFTVVKAGFAHKRKTLGNNLKAIFTEKGLGIKPFELCAIEPSARAEDLTLKDWFCLAASI